MDAEDVTDQAEEICLLTVGEILSVLLANDVPVPRERRRPKAILVEHAIQVAPSEVVDKLLRQAANKRKRKSGDEGKSRRDRKRARQQMDFQDEEMADVEEDGVEMPHHFLRTPTELTRARCYKRFYEATSNTSLEMCVCAVCGRECTVKEDKVSVMPLSLMPNSRRLIPAVRHRAHDLFQGKLLEPAGLTVGEEDPIIAVCGECLQELNKSGEAPPKYSLANRMWIGKVPWELQVLTFPEQLLIALLYPRVYVFKLFPKRTTGASRFANLQRAMRGNVSTYQLNTDAIASMVEGKLMPRPPAILASLISLTFVAVGEIPKPWLHTMFRVRRAVIRKALQWLKHNNPKYYGDVEINTERLEDLPEDDVPDEINAIVRQTENVAVLDEETDGYVPRDENEGKQKKVVHEYGVKTENVTHQRMKLVKPCGLETLENKQAMVSRKGMR